MAQTADEALADIDDARGKIDPQMQGLRHFLGQSDLSDESIRELGEVLANRQHRLDLLTNHEKAALAFKESERLLVEDGHPTLPTETVSESVLVDLRENHTEEGAALDIFRSDAATTLNPTPGFVRPKEGIV